MRHLEGGPPNHALFSGAEPLRDELRRMLAWCRLLLDDDRWQDALDDAWKVPDGAAPRLVQIIRAGQAPPVAYEVLAGLSGVVLTKDYRMRPIWAGAWALIEPVGKRDDADEDPEALLSEDDRDELAEIERSFGKAAADAAREAILAELEGERAERKARREAMMAEQPDLAPYLRAAAAGPSARDLRRGRAPKRAAPSPELLAAADRTALLGVRAASRFEAREARAILWHYREAGAAWEAFCAALDAVGAASHAGLDRLSALADAHAESPAITWLDAIARRVSRDEERGAARMDRLEALLDSGELGAHAREHLFLLKRVREEDGLAIHDAWLRLGALRKSPEHRLDPRDRLSPGQRRAILRGAKEGDPAAQLLVSMDAMYDRLVAEERREEELDGPFDTLGDVPKDIEETIDGALHTLMHGFREAYALELLRDGVPRLEAMLANG
jgi:hypothetical protein